MRYFDSGVLVKLYHEEPNSDLATSHVFAFPPPCPLTPLHVMEVRSAFRQMQGRKELPAGACARLHTDFERDIEDGFYEFIHPAWDEVFLEVERISAQHTSTTLCRTLDTLHVALALKLGAHEFCTFDKRQASLAAAAGLNVIT